MEKNKILILDNHRHTLTVIRSLANAGYDPIVGYHDQFGEKFALSSRYTKETWHHPRLDESGKFIEALKVFLKGRNDIAYIFPVDDGSSGLLARNYNDIIKYCEIIMARPSAIMACLTKTAIFKYVKEHNIPLPETSMVGNLIDIDTQIKRLGYPFILKPVTKDIPFFGKKCVICDTPFEYKKHFPKWPEGHQKLIFQRKILGFIHDCMFTAIKGRVICYFEKRIIRSDTYDGTGFAVDTITVKPSEQRKKYVELLTTSLDYSGIGAVQFVVNDKDDSSYFLEFNPRLDAGNALPYSCGLDFPKQAIDVCKYLKDETTSLPQYSKDYQVGKRIHWLFGDISGLFKEIFQRNISILQGIGWFFKLLNTLCKTTHHVTWSWKDPLPTLVLYKQELLSIITHQLNRLRLRKAGKS